VSPKTFIDAAAHEDNDRDSPRNPVADPQRSRLPPGVDAMTDMNADAHDRALKVIFPRIGELGTAQEILGKRENRRHHSAVRLA
jgi:hypothetical protein